jgi:hypothetical protein
LSRSLVALDQNSTIIAVIEMSQSSWLCRHEALEIERVSHFNDPPSSVSAGAAMRSLRPQSRYRRARDRSHAMRRPASRANAFRKYFQKV